MRRGGRVVPKPRRSKPLRLVAAPAPTLVDPPDQISPSGVFLELQMEATNTTSYTVGAIPAGLAFNGITGKFTGTPTVEETKAISVTAHGPGGEVTVVFNWSITSTPAPTLTSPGPQVNNSGESVNVAISHTNTTSISATGLPPGLSINIATGEVTGTIGEEGTYHPKVTAVGPGGSVTITIEWIVHPFPYGPNAVNPVGNEIYSLIEPLTYADQSLGYPLLRYCDGLGLMWNDLDEIIRDKVQHNGQIIPGWSPIMNLNECPAQFLPWLAQHIGVTAPPNMAALDRELIMAASGMSRGTPQAIKASVATLLTGLKRVDLFERSEGKAYKLTVVTYEAETPNQALVESMLKGEEVVPAGIVIDYKCVPGWIYQALAESGKTYAQLEAEYPDPYTKLVLKQP